MPPKKKKGGKKASVGEAGDDPAILAQIEKQKMAVEMDHLSHRMKILLHDQESMSTQKVELKDKMKKESTKHEHIYNHLNQQITDKEQEIEGLKRQLSQSAIDHATRVEEVVELMDKEQRQSAARIHELNLQVRGLLEKTGRIDEYKAIEAQNRELHEELDETRRLLADTREELDAWQRQTMVLTQPLYKDSVVLLLLEAMRLYPKLEILQVEALAALQNVVSPENPAEILDNCAMIRMFGGIGIVLSSMRDNLTKERIQCNACSLLWKLSFWDSENIPVITANGGMHLLLAAMTAHPDLSLIHISEPTRLLSISYAVFCLKKKKKYTI
eukprot:TRINITY_DN4446_c0_g1_i4.p1 TRINITY_DN4446_c0_g1~~TRINITY_DN4446_c0_g1_i4.p1  ORF type:complete len:329 (-),score=135.00 TRINITY_DN4446_c0_g1_i4:117-1103(-)